MKPLVPLLIAMLLPCTSRAQGGMILPRSFTQLGGEDIQEFTMHHALRHLGKSLYADPVGGDVIYISEIREASLTADVGFDKIVYTLEEVDSTGLRTNVLVRAYGIKGHEESPGHFCGPRSLAVDHNRSVIGNIHRWRFYVADSNNSRIVVLNLGYDTVGDSLLLEHVSFWSPSRLRAPYDLDYDEVCDLLYVLDNESCEIVVFNEAGALVGFYGGEGSGHGEFLRPRGLACDSDGFRSCVFVADTGNNRLVRLKNRSVDMGDLVWENEYSETDFLPVSVTAFAGSGLYALVAYPNGGGVLTFDSWLSQKLGSFGFGTADCHRFYRPTYLRMRDGEVGITDHYGLSTGLSYWVLDAQVMNARATPDPFDPLESWCLISYSLTAHADLSICVYDSLWNRVKAIVDSSLTSCGYQQEIWDGTGDTCGILPNGAYHVVFKCYDYGGDGNPDRDTVDVAISGQSLRMLTNGLFVEDPSWSNAGDRVAFSMTVFDLDTLRGIWVVDVDSLNVTQVTHPAIYEFDEHPDWSPSDSFLVFSRRRTFSTRTTDNPTGAGSMGFPSVASPDIAESWIYKVRVPGGCPILLSTGSEKWDWNPVWSPYLTNEDGAVPSDGGHIAFWRYVDKQLWTMRAIDGSNRRMVTSGEDTIGTYPMPNKGLASWSPDGTEIAFQTQCLDSLGIWKVDVNDGNHSLLCREDSPAGVGGVSWSPNGRFVAYEIFGPSELATGLRAISAVGGFDLEYIVKSTFGCGLDWSPEGTKVAFVCTTGGCWDLAMADFRSDECAFPAANIISPISGQVLSFPFGTDSIEIWGTAYHNKSVDGSRVLSPLEWWKLEWGRGCEPVDWSTEGFEATTWNTPVKDGHLSFWNIEGFEEGEYTVKLTVSDNADINTDEVRVRICGPTSSLEKWDGPTDYAIEEVIPNPSTSHVAIKLAIPWRSQIRVTVYDCRGRMVRRLIDGYLDAGHHRKRWDGRDAHFNSCAPGVYWCRLTAPGAHRTEKIVLLK